MPQLDPSSFPSQLFWLTVSFVTLYIVLARVLLPKVQSVLVLRKRTMDNDVEQAERLKSEAARAAEQYDSTLAAARAKSQAMLAEAQAEIAQRAAKRRAELDASIEARLAGSDADIASARDGVAERLEPVAGDLASLIVEMLVHQKPDSKDIGNAISEVAKGARRMNEAFYEAPTFWVAVSFGVFLVLAMRPVARFIVRALDTRSAQIAADLAEARRLRDEAQAMLDLYRKKQEESLALAETLLYEAKRDAERMSAAAEAELKAALDKRMKLASERIAQSEAKALREVQEHVVDIAIAAARTLIREHLTRSGGKELIKQAAAELERKLH